MLRTESMGKGQLDTQDWVKGGQLTLVKTRNDCLDFPMFPNSGLNSDGSSIVIRFSSATFELAALLSLLGILKRIARRYRL